MTRTKTSAAVAWVWVSVAMVVGASGGQETDPQAVVPIALPDLSGMHEAVQTQVGEAYAAVQTLESVVGGERQAERSAAFGELGKLLMAADVADTARMSFENARRLSPEDYRWPYYLGHLALRRGDLPQAADHLARARLLRPTDLAAQLWLGFVQIELGEPRQARAVLSDALLQYPDSAALIYQMGLADLAVGQHGSAVALLERALNLSPASNAVYEPLGLAYDGLGETARAQEYLERAGGRAGPDYARGAAVAFPDPLMGQVNTMLRSPSALRELGLQAGGRGEWTEASRRFRAAVELEPTNATIRLNLGSALLQTGAAVDALAELQEAVRLDPGLALAHYLIGALFERGGRDTEAITSFQAATTGDPNLVAAQISLADALRRTAQLEASLVPYQAVIHRAEASFGEALALVRLGRYQEAITRLAMAMELHPDEPAFPNALARVLATAPEDEARDGQRALDLILEVAEEHKTAAVAETMAMVLAEVRMFPQAVEWQRFAMGLATDSALPEVAQAMSVNLTRYLQNVPVRTPWRDDDPEYNPGPPVEPDMFGEPQP